MITQKKKIKLIVLLSGILICLAVEAGMYSPETVPAVSSDVFFQEAAEISEIPLLVIETEDGTEPVYKEISPPDDCYGSGITENEYVKGTLQVLKKEEVVLSEGLQLRIRGNASAYPDKKPYKIKLDNKRDLLGRNDVKYWDTDWILLSYGTDLKTVAGLSISQICEMEWVPAFQFVNVAVNGDWKGCYILMESVDKGEGRCNISDDGFIIESDAYWWAEEEEDWFKTDYPIHAMAYTYKYPSSNKITEGKTELIRNYMNAYEAAVYAGDESYAEFIDVESFANWLLTHDLLGTWDSNGSNIYYYKYDLNPENPLSTKMKLGPAWDFDSIYQEVDKWPGIHTQDIAHFDLLMEFDSFRSVYESRWEEISPVVCQQLEEILEEIEDSYGDALQESWELDAMRWNYEAGDLQVEIENTMAWFRHRVEWVNEAM